VVAASGWSAPRDFEPAISQETFLSTTVFNGDTPAGQVADYERLLGNGVFDTQATDVEFAYYSRLPSAAETEALESAFVYYFMYDLPATHRKILSMLALSRQLKAHGIQPIFYVTPLNYELGEQVLGDDFSQHIKKNVALIAGVLRAEKLELLDLSFDLAAFNFLDTEHLTENGKTYVAQRLAAVIDPGPPLQPLAASEPDAVEAPAISRVLTPTSSQQAAPGQSEPTNRRPTAAVQAINTATATPTATARPAPPPPPPPPPPRNN
jgi:hypothetical protein